MPISSFHRNIQSSINKGVAYIIDNFTSNIGWKDFRTNSSGESDSWVSSFIIWQIGKKFPLMLLQKLPELLTNYVQKNKGIGYSLETPTDCDSTVHFINAWLEINLPMNLISEQIDYIIKHQNKDGGFTTYKLEDIRSLTETRDYKFDGWLSSHICVSAAVYEFLSFHNLTNSSSFESLLEYLLEHQNSLGFWESYWWHSHYFATSKILNVMNRANSNSGIIKKSQKDGMNYLINTFNPDGYWDNGIESKDPCVISTCMASSVFLTNDYKYSRKLLQSVVLRFLESQKNDGSWNSKPFFQIPPANMKNSSDFNWTYDSFGVGSCSRDQNNLYTTTLVVRLLSDYIDIH
jgi:squalene cyclase